MIDTRLHGPKPSKFPRTPYLGSDPSQRVIQPFSERCVIRPELRSHVSEREFVSPSPVRRGFAHWQVAAICCPTLLIHGALLTGEVCSDECLQMILVKPQYRRRSYGRQESRWKKG